MKAILKRTTAFLVILSLCVGTTIVPSWAAIQSSYYLNAYRAWLSPITAGRINIVVDVQANDHMDEVGASRIELFESEDDGETWKSIRVYLKSIYPEMVATNTYFYYDTPITYKGTIGNKYIAVVTVYAGDSTGSDTREYTTAAVTAIKK